ncbi:hypothetical protein JT358_11795 [Micrococcales bacterium 31B]|nr:hypothetical protein [Micrococcales bacterium 31B]
MSSSSTPPPGAPQSRPSAEPLPDFALRALRALSTAAESVSPAGLQRSREREGNVGDNAHAAARAKQILFRWEQLSSASAWLRFGEWRSEAVDALAHAMAENRSAHAAAGRLGRQRAFEGVGLKETLDDLHCGLIAGGYVEFELELIREASQSWADTTIDPATRLDWVDPISGLVNSDFLEVRLHEVFERHGGAAAEQYCLIAVDGQVQGASTWSRDARDMVLGQAVLRACKRGQTKAKLANGTILILEERDEGLAERFELVKDVVGEHARSAHAVQIRRPARVWIEGLPSTAESAWELVRSLAS